jgi:hypothetical protein
MLDVTREDTLQLSNAIAFHAIPELEKYWAFNVETGDQYDLNESAYFLLSLFSEPTVVLKALIDFSNIYELSINEVDEDCLPILSQYLNEGLFERR